MWLKAPRSKQLRIRRSQLGCLLWRSGWPDFITTVWLVKRLTFGFHRATNSPLTPLFSASTQSCEISTCTRCLKWRNNNGGGGEGWTIDCDIRAVRARKTSQTRLTKLNSTLTPSGSKIFLNDAEVVL